MSAKFNRAFLATATLATLSASWGCVADRPSRNGVFNENQYVRKDFLVRSGAVGSDGKPADDPGWVFQAAVTSASTPNPLSGFGLSTGDVSPIQIVRFDVTSDKLRMINTREIGAVDPTQATRDPEVTNAWPITNVDLKYRINLDGEKTNFFEENQELDWKVRQWVKLNFAKNDGSDLAPLNIQEVLAACTDQGNSSVTLVPDSFLVDEQNDYMSWNVNMTFPLNFSDTACTQMYGEPGMAFQKLGRQTVNYTLKYSMTRAKALNPDGTSADGYVPFELAEKDTIRRKYGTIDDTHISRDNDTNLLAARQLVIRHNPNKPIIYYFAPGYPDARKKYFTDPGGIIDQTNQIFTDAGAAARLIIRNFDDPTDLPKTADGQVHVREWGDVRYNWLRWVSDVDSGGQTGVLADTSLSGTDPRTGENISGHIRFYNFNFTDFVQARLELYLQSVGALPTNPDGTWTTGSCTEGQVLPFVAASTDTTAATLASRNSHSTLYGKMQEYLLKPVAKWGNLSPADFVVKQDADFFNALYAILPYQMYGDPAANQFVTPEGSGNAFGGSTANVLARARTESDFASMVGDMDHGNAPFDITPGPDGVKAAAAFADKLKAMAINHREFNFAQLYNKNQRRIKSDSSDMFNYIDVFQRDGRHCINGQWETKEQYETSMADSYYAQTVWHEFGHTLGLDHNWMGSVDRPNFPHYKDAAGDHIGGYSSSLMDYNATPDRVFWKNESAKFGWYPYDRAAIAFIYANNQKAGCPAGAKCTPGGPIANAPDACAPANVCSFSGQSKTGDTTFSRFVDPYGANTDKSEKGYLYCNDAQLKYTPFCRQFDFGTTPSEIMAAAIDNYEWQYKWRNFRLYRKFQDYTNYQNGPLDTVTEMRRFISQWIFDWSGGELQDTLRRIGVTAPANVPAATYFGQLTDKFNRDISMANQLAGAFHKAIIQQSSGERPFKTIYDNFFGDVTQQGIFSDKLFALQSWIELWPVDNYDPDQAAGVFNASYSSFAGDTSFENISEDAVDSMVGGQYDTYPFLRLTAVTVFAKATHDLNFPGRIDTRDWIGGHVFGRERDFLDYFRGIAVKTNVYCAEPLTLDTCTYDPRLRRAVPSDVGHSDDFNEFTGPDNRRYAWTYVQDRNTWVVVDRDRNTASYQIVRSYNNQVIHGEDGSVAGFFIQLQVKYFLDSFLQYN
jgi:Met-zincin